MLLGGGLVGGQVWWAGGFRPCQQHRLLLRRPDQQQALFLPTWPAVSTALLHLAALGRSDSISPCKVALALNQSQPRTGQFHPGSRNQAPCMGCKVLYFRLEIARSFEYSKEWASINPRKFNEP